MPFCCNAAIGEGVMGEMPMLIATARSYEGFPLHGLFCQATALLQMGNVRKFQSITGWVELDLTVI